MKDRYCILPRGNAAEFPQLDAELVRRGVAAKYCEMPPGGRIYLIPGSQVKKLPKDEKGHYLGDDNSGHSIYPMATETIETDRKEWRCGEWKDVK